MFPVLTFLRLSALATLVACSDKSDDSAASGACGSPANAFFTATVDGTTWDSDPATAAWTLNHGDLLSIQGNPADYSSAINGNIFGYAGPGTYALTTGQTYAQLVGGATSAEPGAWVSTTGTVDITCDDGTVIAGTISFEGTDDSLGTTKVVSAGEFVIVQPLCSTSARSTVAA